MPYTPIPYARDPAESGQSRRRVIDLIMAGGQARADQAARSGEIWGRAFSQLGGIPLQIAQAKQQEQESKAIAEERQARAAERESQAAHRQQQDAAAKREAERAAAEDAGLRHIFSKNPQPSLGELSDIVGVERATKILQGVTALNDLPGKQGDEALKRLVPTAAGFGALSPQMQAQMWPHIRTAALNTGLFQQEALPEQFTPELGAEVAKFAQAYQGKTDKEPPRPQVVGRALVGPDGKVIYRDPTEPSDATRPVAVLGDDGQPIYVKPGEAVGRRPAPSTTAKDTTEDERKTAGFYTQMSEAIKILDETEAGLSQKELYQIQTLPQEGLVGMANRGELSENAKRYLRAFEQFTESRLRPVSGAAIANTEYERDRRTYAKQYGETPKLSQDRRQARTSALGTLKTRAGRALPKDDKKTDPLGLF